MEAAAIPVSCQAGKQGREVQRRDGLVGDHDGTLLRQHRSKESAGAGKQSVADDDFVAGSGEVHGQPMGGTPIEHRVQDTAGGDLGRFVSAIHDHVGLGIKGGALVEQSVQDFGRITAAQQGAVITAGDPADEGGQRAAQPDGYGLGMGRRARVRVHICPAAEREDHRVAGQKTADDTPFAFAEFAFTIASKDFRDGAAGSQFDLGVGVAEGQPEPGGEAPSDRGLACAHQSDKHDTAPDQRIGQRIGQRRGVKQGGVARHRGER